MLKLLIIVQFKDFVPNIKKNFLFTNELENLDSTLERMNTWIRQNEMIEIINIETVALPNIHGSSEEGSTDPELSFQEYKPVWYQFFRIWYR